MLQIILMHRKQPREATFMNKCNATDKLYFVNERELRLENHSIILELRGAYDKFPDFFCMGTFIDSTHMKI